ncbi:MAG: substrate-binding domain-containing protein, partial [Fimbriimonadales bacterium]
RGVPVVVIGSDSQGRRVSTVDVDNVACGWVAAEHLINLGHTRLAYVGRVPDKSSSLERLQGALSAIEAHGLPKPIVVDGAYRWKSGYEMAGTLLGLPEEELPTGWICSNDEIAYGASLRLREAGVAVPGRVSLIGTDDTVFAQMAEPALTTLRQPLHAMGVKAAEILAERAVCRDLDVTQAVFPVELVVRASTGPVGPTARPTTAGYRA